MKKFILFGSIILGLALCTKKENNSPSYFLLDQSFEIRNGQTINDSIHRISVNLDSVVNDSRCPSDVECVWEGNAQVRFVFSSNSKNVSFDLNTIPSFRTDSLIEGYRIKLIELTPYPRSTDPINRADYKAILKITRE